MKLLTTLLSAQLLLASISLASPTPNTNELLSSPRKSPSVHFTILSELYPPTPLLRHYPPNKQQPPYLTRFTQVSSREADVADKGCAKKIKRAAFAAAAAASAWEISADAPLASLDMAKRAADAATATAAEANEAIEAEILKRGVDVRV